MRFVGVYKPRIKCYDVNQLSLKFERCLCAEVTRFAILSDDYSKLALLLADRNIEFHVQHGFHYRIRIPTFGRDLAYHYPSCDLFITAACSEVYRLNLEQGRFLTPLTNRVSACTVCGFNSEHQLLTIGTEEGTVECWDPRSHSHVRRLALASAGVNYSDSPGCVPSVTSLRHKNSLHFAVGTSTGQVLCTSQLTLSS